MSVTWILMPNGGWRIEDDEQWFAFVLTFGLRDWFSGKSAA